MSRYDRQVRIEGWDQEKLYKSRVCLVGAGALGNVIGTALAQLGVGELKIYDNDRIEITNFNRQFQFTPEYLGEKKALVLASRLGEINPEIKISGYPVRINRRNVKLLGKPNLIVDCLDNFETRVILNEYAVKEKISLVSGGMGAFDGQIAVYIPGKTSCIDCKLDIKRLAQQARERCSYSCSRNPDPSIVTTAMVVGGEMSQQIRKLLAPVEEEKPLNGILKYDALTTELYTLPTNRREGCPCGF